MDPFFIVFLIVCGLAALVDFLIYKIPNEALIFLLALFFIKVFMNVGFEWSAFKTPLMLFGMTFSLCFMLYAVKMVGAGDAKFIAVVSLWVADAQPLLFFIFMTLAGAVLGLIYLKLTPFIDTIRLHMIERLSSLGFMKRYLTGKKKAPVRPLKNPSALKIPYGVAVFAGVLLMLNFN